MKLNKAVSTPVFTHEGGRGSKVNAREELNRAVSACTLWEGTFYESGVSIANRIRTLTGLLPAREVSELALKARTELNLRHVPLLLCRELARQGRLTAPMLEAVIRRPDELAEFLAIYWKDGKQSLSSQTKKGLAQAFRKFDAYSLAKYNRDASIKLRDVLFMVHAKPKDEAQASLWKQLVDGTLVSPDTWEVALSSGADKGETFARLIKEGKLGAFALLRNLRNMEEAKVDRALVRDALSKANVSKILPFRFIAAARHAMAYEPELEAALFRSLEGSPKFEGNTVILVDVSGSMDDRISAKSEMTRLDAACGIAMVARELCPEIEVHTFSMMGTQAAPRRGFALRDAIVGSQPHGGTYLAGALGAINSRTTYDRIIVVTDEQSHDGIVPPQPASKAYIINVAAFQNGVGYGRWTHINGFSEAVIKYIQTEEARLAQSEEHLAYNQGVRGA